MFGKIVTALAIVLILFFIFGCAGRAQPYGEDIWAGYKHMEQSRKVQ